jgi:nitrile hydratase accessory protein
MSSDAVAVPPPDLSGAAAVPRKNGELVFDEPWQSRAFGMAVGLHQQGLFHWDEFRDRLIEAVATLPGGDPSASPAAVYYRQWLAALEKLLVDKSLLAKAELDGRVDELLAGEHE